MGPALPIAREAARDLADDGAEAVVLVGSHARGDAGPESDLDLLAIGPREFSCRLDRRDGSLVSASSRPFEAYRKELGDPGSVCKAVPGWREAVVLHDPRGMADALISEARAWTWAPLERRCDSWVAEQITSLAEEVHKLTATPRSGNLPNAAAQRSLLAIHLPPVMAVHHRILYGTENRLWDLASDAMGGGWRSAQYSAFGLHGGSFEETCRAARRMYELAAEAVEHLLDGRQKRVVRHALGLAGYSGLAGGSESL